MQNHDNQIIIADNQFLITEALKKLLFEEFNIDHITLVGSKYELIKVLASNKVSLLIIDYNHIDFEDIGEIQKYISKDRDFGMLVLINSLQKNELFELNAMGIKNILLKTADRDELITGTRSALSGKRYYSQEILDLFSEMHNEKHVIKENVNLTISEIEIVKAIVEGFTTKQIASRKFISYHTVMTHRKNIFRKLNINNASELVMFAIRNGIVDIIDYQI
jgi:DNA-binding NarL/FixJ family response regulator